MQERPGRLPPLATLVVFESAARLASFTRAANELNVTQGAISRQVRALEALHQLADVLVELEKSEPQPELREQVEHAFGRVTPLLWPHIDDLRGQIDEHRAKRSTTAPEDRLELELETRKLTERLDLVYGHCQTHREKREALGQDTSEAQATFTRALSDRADEVSGRIDLALERMDDLERRHSESPDDATIPALLVAVKQSLIIETGVAHGGSLIYYASIAKAADLPTRVVGVDIEIRPHNRTAIEEHTLFDRIELIDSVL